MNIKLLENAQGSLQKVKVLEEMVKQAYDLHRSGEAYSAMQKFGTHSDPTGNAVQRLEKLIKQLGNEINQATSMFNGACSELSKVTDGEMQGILFMRHFEKRKWSDIADQLKNVYTVDAIKQKYIRFVREQCDE